MPGNSDSRPRRPIRSFILREGRLTHGQSRALDRLMPVYGRDARDGTINAGQWFGRQAPLVVEIGFGNGEALVDMAIQEPHWNFIGLEVHRPGVGHLLLRLESQEIDNVRVIADDAVEVLSRDFEDGSIDRICLYFPDPWPKKKHHKRRIVQDGFMAMISAKLAPGGIFHFATDWEDYAFHALEIIDRSPGLTNLAGGGCFSPRPGERPLTKFEQRGLNLGHGVWDILAQKSDSQD